MGREGPPTGRGGDPLGGLWRLARAIVGRVFELSFALHVEGLDQVPERGPTIVAPNHVSVLDGPALAMAVARRGRPVRFLVTAGAFRIPILGTVLRLFGQIPIRRGGGDAGALEEAVATVRSGALAGIFPEGRVNDPPAERLQRGRTGVGRVALAAGAPVVPVGIWGTQTRWPRGGPWRRQPLRPPLAIVFGDPIPPEGDVGDWEDVAAFTARVMAGVETCVGRARELTSSR